MDVSSSWSVRTAAPLSLPPHNPCGTLFEPGSHAPSEGAWRHRGYNATPKNAILS